MISVVPEMGLCRQCGKPEMRLFLLTSGLCCECIKAEAKELEP